MMRLQFDLKGENAPRKTSCRNCSSEIYIKSFQGSSFVVEGVTDVALVFLVLALCLNFMSAPEVLVLLTGVSFSAFVTPSVSLLIFL